MMDPHAETAQPQVDVLILEDEETKVGLPWKVILYDDDIHTFDEVIVQLVKATRCSVAHAEKVTWHVHTRGKEVAYEGDFEDCFHVQGILREIQLVTEIEG